MNEGESEQAELQPGDLTADELVRLHRDLDPGPNDAGYAGRWRDWQGNMSRLTTPNGVRASGHTVPAAVIACSIAKHALT
jgi:hypothetical protein